MRSGELRARAGALSFATLSFATLLFTLGACGPEVPHGGVIKTPADAPDDRDTERRPPEPVDLLPGDLDVVIRVDLSTVRDSLGADTSELLLERAADVASAEGLVREALAKAEVVWLGLRMADLEHGDRVMVIRSVKERGDQEPMIAPDDIAWSREPTAVEGVARWVSKSGPPRQGIERIFTFGKRQAVFVSPVQSHSVERVLKRGADQDRGQPAARGLVSFDYRTGRLSNAHENAYPSLAALVAGMVRMRATVDVVADQLELDGRIQCKTNTAAAKVHRFLETIVTATARRPRYTALLENLTITQNESVISVKWPLPRAVVAALLVDRQPAEPAAVPAPPKATPSPPPPPGEPPSPRPETPEPTPEATPEATPFDFERPVDLPPPPGAGGISPE